MPGLEDFPMNKFLYGTDNMGEGYAEDEKWWADLLTDMGRTPQELGQFLYGNAARILGIAAE
jgi:predicted TIM-barrel fold metal-dependent hydrolase